MSRPLENTQQSTRRIAPHPRRDGKDRHGEPSRKRRMVPAACLQCQRRKCKCDGSRPQCQPCAIRRMDCEFDVLEGTSQKDRVKQKYEALEHKYSDLEALIAELRYSDEELALSLLVRLRADEPVHTILQAVSPNSISDEFDVDPSMGYASSAMSHSTSSSQIMCGSSDQSPPFSSLAPGYPLAYPDNTSAYLDTMLGVNGMGGFQGDSEFGESFNSKEVILALSSSSASSVGDSEVYIHLHQPVAWQKAYNGAMNAEKMAVDWQQNYPGTENIPVSWYS